MQDDKLDALLRQLPAATASGDFTQKVLGRLQQRPERGGHFRPLLAAAAAVVVATTVAVTATVQHREQVRMQSLAAEQRELRRDLEILKTSSANVEALVPIGSTDDADYVLDVGELSVGGRGVVYTSHAPKETYEY